MDDEAGFLSAIRRDPADDTGRLAYADWLDERGDDPGGAKSEFLRLTARQLHPDRPAGDDGRLRQFAAGLDTDWLAVVSRLKVEVCAGRRTGGGMRLGHYNLFRFVCDRRWDEMAPTEDGAVRFCTACRENVHYCDTITAARRHAEQGHCVAVDLGIPRRHDDLSPRRAWVGRPNAATLREEEERCKVDDVSRERERRKRNLPRED